ncbi:MAG: hypothetical protein ACTHOE_04055 [Conexibacter sp.]
MTRVNDIAAQKLDEPVADDAAWWVDSERFETLLRDAHADAPLLQELDELAPDTIGEL